MNESIDSKRGFGTGSGRQLTFKDPQELDQLCMNYLDHISMQTEKILLRNGTEVEVPKCAKWMDLAAFCGVSSKTLNQYMNGDHDNANTNYSRNLTLMREKCLSNMFDHGLKGYYNDRLVMMWLNAIHKVVPTNATVNANLAIDSKDIKSIDDMRDKILQISNSRNTSVIDDDNSNTIVIDSVDSTK